MKDICVSVCVHKSITKIYDFPFYFSNQVFTMEPRRLKRKPSQVRPSIVSRTALGMLISAAAVLFYLRVKCCCSAAT